MEELKITRERAIKRMEWILKHEIYCSDKLSHAAITMAITALRSAAPENKIEGECTMDKKSEEIFNKLYDLHDRYDEDPKHMICAEAADHIKKLSEELEKFKATSENKALTLEEIKHMNDQPVWIAWLELSQNYGHWRICYGLRARKRHGREVIDFGNGLLEFCDEYGKAWLAYARKPEGSEAS